MKTIEQLRTDSIQELTELVQEMLDTLEMENIHVRYHPYGRKVITVYGTYTPYTVKEQATIEHAVWDDRDDYYGVGMGDYGSPFLVLSDCERDSFWRIEYFSTATILQVIKKLKDIIAKS